ncbi:olfactory receptor 2AT4-like [Protopterus annectens]|uniref:olfactory receptor 2AT4-like n=1 Tax=Protopterus annectens TaxID=7888 RepID=UPI001CF97B99|nr:olfactory receptor 2AT4-like [Protopterus annectens]
MVNHCYFSVLQQVEPNLRGGDVDSHLLECELRWIVRLRADKFPGVNDRVQVKPLLPLEHVAMVVHNLSSSVVTEFMFAGFLHLHNYYTIFFILFLLIYSTVIIGNSLILAAVITNRKLHTPMYFFLSNLAVIDLFYTTTVIPRMLTLFIVDSQTISFSLCFVQLCFLHGFGIAEAFLLVVMAYDRYVAICSPLHYQNIMTNMVNILLAANTWILPFIIVIPIVILAAQLPFCGPNKIHHCFCEHVYVIKLACTDITPHVYLGFSVAMTVSFIPLFLVVFSYIKILTAVFQLASTEERLKALSTCTSHIMVVSFYYVSIIVAYVSYTTDNIANDFHVASTIFCAILTPTVNPVIYTLRNRDVKSTVTKLIKSVLKY